MSCRYVLALLPLLLARDLEATQDERTLKRAFEGTRVTVRMDLPGTEDGVEVYPGTGTPPSTMPDMPSGSRPTALRSAPESR